jgi:DNA-directed RNA polymerase specialized sigma24 family protein
MTLNRKSEGAEEVTAPLPNLKISVPQLKAIYECHGGVVYSLCLGLLTRKKAAEDATVEAFVQFWRYASGRWDESQSLSCLRELAIQASRRRLQKRWLWKLRSVMLP